MHLRIAVVVLGVCASLAGQETVYSKQPEANSIMISAEQDFHQKDFDSALKKYQQALALDPKLYDAALFSGNVYLTKRDFPTAAKWYASAIAIDPNQGEAYYFWGMSLEAQGQRSEAQHKWIAAIVAEPYDSAMQNAFQHWAQRSGYSLHSMALKFPENYDSSTVNGTVVTNIGQSKADTDKGVLSPWSMYAIKKIMFQRDGFAKAYPAEKTYRHSLEEEEQAINAALEGIEILKLKDSELDPTLRTLRKLKSEGLLDSWILLDDADEGITQDYGKYRDAHRSQVAQYVQDYWLSPASSSAQ